MSTVNDRIVSIVEEALTNVQTSRYVRVGVVSAELARKVKDVIGRDIQGYVLVLDSDHIRHVLRQRHKDLSVQDFLLLPTILKNPDTVKHGNKENSIVIKKTLAMEYTCVEVIVDTRRTLRFKTLYISKRLKKGCA